MWTTAALALLVGCSAASTPRAAGPKATTTTLRSTTTTTAPTTTTTAAPTTTRPPTTTAAPTTAPAPRTTTPQTTVGLHRYGDVGLSCLTYNSNQLTPVRAVPWNITATANWSDGYVEHISDNAAHKPPAAVTMVGSRGTRVVVQIYWDPTKPSYAIPPGPPGAWTCRAASVT